MKFTLLKALEKHLSDASPLHFSPLYFVLSKEKGERDEAEELLIDALLKGHGRQTDTVSRFYSEKHSASTILAELTSLSLLSSRRLVIIANAEKLNKEATQKLEEYIAAPTPDTFLIITAESIKRSTKFYKTAENAGVVLDIAEEKPWQRVNTLTQKVCDWVGKRGKQIDLHAARYLVEGSSHDQALLLQEVEKLICYVGEQPSITKEDIAAITTRVNHETIWQLAEAIFLGQPALALKANQTLMEDPLLFFSLIRQLRSQFKTKLQIQTILSEGGSSADIQQLFPYMRGKILQENVQQAQAYGLRHLRYGLTTIDATEIEGKNSQTPHSLLMERLIMKLTGKLYEKV